LVRWGPPSGQLNSFSFPGRNSASKDAGRSRSEGFASWRGDQQGGQRRKRCCLAVSQSKLRHLRCCQLSGCTAAGRTPGLERCYRSHCCTCLAVWPAISGRGREGERSGRCQGWVGNLPGTGQGGISRSSSKPRGAKGAGASSSWASLGPWRGPRVHTPRQHYTTLRPPPYHALPGHFMQAHMTPCNSGTPGPPSPALLQPTHPSGAGQ